MKPEGKECTLSNEQLIESCNKWVSKLCSTGGSAWCLRVPVDFDQDPDMLFIELGKRLTSSQRSLSDKDKEIEQLKAEIMSQGDIIVSIGKILLQPNEREKYDKEIAELKVEIERLKDECY